MYGHDAENVIEAKIRYSNEVESRYLLKSENIPLSLSKLIEYGRIIADYYQLFRKKGKKEEFKIYLVNEH